MRTTRLDLIKNETIVLIVRKGNSPFLVKSKSAYNNKVSGIWLLTGEEISLSSGEATLPTDNEWVYSLIEELKNEKIRIDERIKFIKKTCKLENK